MKHQLCFSYVHTTVKNKHEQSSLSCHLQQVLGWVNKGLSPVSSCPIEKVNLSFGNFHCHPPDTPPPKKGPEKQHGKVKDWVSMNHWEVNLALSKKNWLWLKHAWLLCSTFIWFLQVNLLNEYQLEFLPPSREKGGGLDYVLFQMGQQEV